MPLQRVFTLEVWLAHFDERLRVVRPSDHATVVVAQHHDGCLGQIRSEHTLTARIERVVLGLDKS